MTLKEYYHHVDLLWELVIRDLQGRYVGASMGMFWTVIHPLIMIALYTLVFSHIMGAKLPGTSDVYGYSIYLCAGLLPWNAFSESMLQSTHVFLVNAHLLKKVVLPKTIFLLYVQIVSIINLCISLFIFLLFLVITGHYPNLPFLLLPVLVGMQQIFALGLGMIFATLNVYFRDTGQLVGVMLQLWFWLTPIVYRSDILPTAMKQWTFLNPWMILIEMYHQTIFFREAPQVSHFIYFCLIALCTFALGVLTFQTLKHEIVDVI